MTKTITGNLEYTIEISDTSCEIKMSQKLEDELAACIITKFLVGYIKQNLLESLKVVKGKDINLYKDRLGKITSTETVLALMTEDYIYEINNRPETPELELQEPIIEQEEIKPLENI